MLDAHPSLLGSVVDRLVRAAKITAENDPEDRPSLDVTRALEHVVKTCSKDRVEQFVREAYGSQLLNNAVQRSAAWRRIVGYCVNRGIISNTIVEASKNRVKNVLNTETIWIKELRKEEEKSEENLVVRDVRVVTDDVDPKLRDDALEAEVVRWEDSSNNTTTSPVVIRGVPIPEVTDIDVHLRRTSRNVVDSSFSTSSKEEDNDVI